jgi:uncharacterized protein (DUF1697 family)
VTIYVALLRGINVGGKNPIGMPGLRACFEAGGFNDVRTYIQSGNVIFSAPTAKPRALAERIEGMLEDAFAYEPTVVVRSDRQIRAVVDGAPRGFGSRPNEYRYDAIFLKEPLSARAALREVPTNPTVDGVTAGRGVLYFSRLTSKATQSRMNRIVASEIYPSVTIRNWRTTTALAQMMSR